MEIFVRISDIREISTISRRICPTQFMAESITLLDRGVLILSPLHETVRIILGEMHVQGTGGNKGGFLLA